MNENGRLQRSVLSVRLLVSLGLGVMCLPVAAGCKSDADWVCERLDACGCLSESVDSCSERLTDEDAAAVELCAQCLSAHDYMCHELGSNHAVCGGCTDDFASSDRVRELDPQAPPYDDSNYPDVVDLKAQCLEAE